MSKNKIKNNKLFNIDKSTSTFLKLMSKYHKQMKKMKNNKDKCYIVKAIDDKRYQIENEEKDDIYIYKEAKNAAYINQELLNTYGIKAKNKSYDISNFQTPMKLVKKKFFDPTKQEFQKTKKIKCKGLINLPFITPNYSFNININL